MMYFKKLGLVWIGSMLCFSKLLAQSAVPTFDVSTDYQGRACLIVNLMVNAAEGSQKIFLMSRSTNAQKWQEVSQWRLSHLPERASYSNIPVTFVLFEQPEWFENGQEALYFQAYLVDQNHQKTLLTETFALQNNDWRRLCKNLLVNR